MGPPSPAFANVATPQSTPAPSVSTVNNSDGTVTVTVSGQWKWTTLKGPSTKFPCDHRFGVGWAMVWNDSNDSGTALTYNPGPVTVDVGSTGTDPRNTDHSVAYNHADPCGTFDQGSKTASGTWTGTHVYASKSVLPAETCVVTYDLTGNGRGGPDPARLEFTNADNSVRDSLKATGTWDTTPGGANCVALVPVATTPTLSTKATGAASPKAIGDTAVLSGTRAPSGGTATGTLTFAAYGPHDSSCSATPVFSTQVPVDGNGTYGPVKFFPPPNIFFFSQTYRWIVSYSGDADNAPITGRCGTPSEISIYRRDP